MAKVTRGYEEMVRSMDAAAGFLSRVRAERGPTERQIAEHRRDLAESREQARKDTR